MDEFELRQIRKVMMVIRERKLVISSTSRQQ